MTKKIYFISIIFCSTLFAFDSTNLDIRLKDTVKTADLAEVKKLIKEGAKIDSNEYGNTLLCEAYIQWGAAEKKEEAIKSGAIPNRVIPGMSQETSVASEKIRNFIEGLYSLGAKPDGLSEKYRCLPTLIVAYSRFEKQILHLIQKKADIKLQDVKGNTALHLAAKMGIEKVVIELINLKADLNIKNKAGNTPADVAVLSFNSTIANLISTKGGKFSKDIFCKKSSIKK